MFSCNTAKNHTHFTNFPASMFSGWCQEKHLHCTISRLPRTAFSRLLEWKCLHIPVDLRKKTFVPEM